MRTLKPPKSCGSTSPRSRQAISDILTAARDVLIEEGYPRLTMRNVAARAGMTVGNLSYHYVNKEALLHDLFEAVIQDYLEEFSSIAENVERTPEERFDDMIRFVVSDLGTKETTGFFPALWALANHNEFAASELNRAYEVECNAFARTIGEIRPDLSAADRELLALFVSASIEGHTMFIGYGRADASSCDATANIAAYSFRTLVKKIDRGTIVGSKSVALPNSPRLRTRRE